PVSCPAPNSLNCAHGPLKLMLRGAPPLTPISARLLSLPSRMLFGQTRWAV
ncbi:hypothetical protein NQL81_004669, partial [Salmonella enterica]|nr:hypothetical protein [Salmonella enterica]EJY3301335.1 hypothetical protein [Salmonella enterica]